MLRKSAFLIIAFIVLTAIGCSGGSTGNPVSADESFSSMTGGRTAASAQGRVLWGIYHISIDRGTLEATVLPLRSATFNVNVTRFMQPPVSPVNRIGVFVDPGASDIPNGLFAVDITLNHPFPGLSQYSGFDVRGIFMADGSVASSHYPGLFYASTAEARLLNADGWTRWWNPTEFTTYGTIFGYTKGSMATPGYTASATLNPYKYFCDGLDSQVEMYVDPSTRGFFSDGASNKRRYLIQFEASGGSPIVEFNYAVDASWHEPSGQAPYTIDEFSLSANCQEAYQITAADAGSDAWFVNGTQNGGNLVFDIGVFDWQAPQNPQGVPGEVAAIWVESPMLASPVNVLPSATVSPAGPTSSVFHVEIQDVHPTGLTGQVVMIAVESKSPSDYAPNLEGISGFAYPQQPLAAYWFWEAPILNEEPLKIPAPAGLDNCAAAGIVKLFWQPVTWPTLDGYRVYRKLATEPDFNFSAPLNSTVLKDTVYWDTNVQMNGTTYDYVVTAVDLNGKESKPSNQTTATPQYVAPTGFTDLDNPDGKMGSINVANFINAFVNAEGKIALAWDWGPRFVWGKMDGTYGTTLSLGSGGQAPDVAMDSKGNAHVVWTNSQGSSDRYFYYATITPNNAVQNQTTIYSFTWPGYVYWTESGIAVTPDDTVHMVFVSYSGGPQLVYISGTPGNWSSPVAVTTDVGTYTDYIGIDMVSDRQGNLHLVWMGSGNSSIKYSKKSASGSWSSPVTVSTGVSGSFHSLPSVAVDPLGAVHVSWCVNTMAIAYANNRSGSFQGFVVANVSSTNFNGVACDRHGNAYVDYWSSGITRVALINRSNQIVEIAQVNDDLPYEGSWCTMTGITDVCHKSNTSVIAFWKEFPNSPPPVFGRIQTDY